MPYTDYGTPDQTRDRSHQMLIGATYGRFTPFEIPTWDETFGLIWIYRDASGLIGIVRAQSWEEAYECVTDEIMSDADPDDPDNQPDEDGNLPEGIYCRGNGVPSNPNRHSYLASYDLNGESLQPLTRALARDLGVRLQWDND